MPRRSSNVPVISETNDAVFYVVRFIDDVWDSESEIANYADALEKQAAGKNPWFPAKISRVFVENDIRKIEFQNGYAQQDNDRSFRFAEMFVNFKQLKKMSFGAIFRNLYFLNWKFLLLPYQNHHKPLMYHLNRHIKS
jgi:hypothetical protein